MHEVSQSGLLRADTRAMRTFSKAAYQGGVVIVKCGNDECGSRHLIADHLGWFGAKGRTVEDMMQDKGQGAPRLPPACVSGPMSNDTIGESGNCQQRHVRVANMWSAGCCALCHKTLVFTTARHSKIGLKVRDTAAYCTVQR